MDVVLSKKQLNLLKELATGESEMSQVDSSAQNSSSQNGASINITNPNNNNNTSSIETDMNNAEKMPGASNFTKQINVPSYTNQTIPKSNLNKVVQLPRNMVKNYIMNTNGRELAGRINVIPNGAINSSREIKGKLVEVTKFKKKELDKFLKSL